MDSKQVPYYMVNGTRSIFFCPKFGAGVEGKIGGKQCDGCDWRFHCLTSVWEDPLKAAGRNNAMHHEGEEVRQFPSDWK